MRLDERKTLIQIAEKKESITSLCEMTGLSRSAITKAIYGKGTPRPATLGKIAEALGVDLERIIADE